MTPDQRGRRELAKSSTEGDDGRRKEKLLLKGKGFRRAGVSVLDNDMGAR